MLDKWGYTHSRWHRHVCNTYCFSTVTVTRTRLGVTLYVHCLCCVIWLHHSSNNSCLSSDRHLIVFRLVEKSPRPVGVRSLCRIMSPALVPSVCVCLSLFFPRVIHAESPARLFLNTVLSFTKPPHYALVTTSTFISSGNLCTFPWGRLSH